MILRKPFGFALIYTLLTGALGALLKNEMQELALIPLALLLIFTLGYIFFVKAHLSNRFRIFASLFLALLAVVVKIGEVFIQSFDFAELLRNPYLLYNPYTWLNAGLYFVAAYLIISLANWIAGFFFKGKGHI